MVRSTWDALVADLDDHDLALIEAFRSMNLALPDTEERVHVTEVHYRVGRTYATGCIRIHRLEVGLDLRREVAHPLLRMAFQNTTRYLSHRFRVESLVELQDLASYVEEAHDSTP